MYCFLLSFQSSKQKWAETAYKDWDAQWVSDDLKSAFSIACVLWVLQKNKGQKGQKELGVAIWSSIQKFSRKKESKQMEKCSDSIKFFFPLHRDRVEFVFCVQCNTILHC